MAITKVIFTASVLGAQNRDEVYNFLNEYAADYFDDISNNESAEDVTCITAGVIALTLCFGNATKTKIALANGTNVVNADYDGTYGQKVIRYGYATPYGVLLADTSNGITIITKSSANKTAIITMLTPTSSSPAYGLYFGDIVSNSAWYKPKSNGADIAALRALHMIDGAASLTTLTPVVLGNGGTYAPHVFVTSYSENGGITSPKKLTISGKEYVYDGLFALEA